MRTRPTSLAIASCIAAVLIKWLQTSLWGGQWWTSLDAILGALFTLTLALTVTFTAAALGLLHARRPVRTLWVGLGLGALAVAGAATSAWVPSRSSWPTLTFRQLASTRPVPAVPAGTDATPLPGRLRDPRQLTPVRHRSEPHARDASLAQKTTRPAVDRIPVPHP